MAKDPAPALGRGLSLLRLLERDGAASLERLAATTTWPKTSVLRLLQSLELAGAVQRDPFDKRYAAVLRLTPLPGLANDLVVLCRPALSDLAARGATAELYEWREGRLTMVDRRDPESGEILVVARIGHHRDLDEFEALSQVVHAFAPRQPAARLWAWQRGRRHRLSIQAVSERLARCRDTGLGEDPEPNGNGIVRIAVGLQGEGRLRAVLAVALPQAPVDRAVWHGALSSWRQRLSA